MADTNPPGSLFVGDGVLMKGTMQVPGLASVDGKLQGQLTADVIAIQSNGSIDGNTTANHIKVAGSLTDTTVANKTLVEIALLRDIYGECCGKPLHRQGAVHPEIGQCHVFSLLAKWI